MVWWVRCGHGAPTIVDSVWSGKGDAQERVDELCGGRPADPETGWWCEQVDPLGAPPSLPIPREVSAVDGCDCSGGGDLHLVGCALKELPSRVYAARVSEAERRVRAFVAGVGAAWRA